MGKSLQMVGESRVGLQKMQLDDTESEHRMVRATWKWGGEGGE